MWHEGHRERLLRLLEAIGLEQAAGEPLDPGALAEELRVPEAAVRMDLDQLEHLGLALAGLEDEIPPTLLVAGSQYLDRRGRVDHEVLRFLPRVLDDLATREALLLAGTVVVDEFRAAVLDGRAVEHARDVVPPAFEGAVDERLALDLYAAAVALMARLSEGAPAGCVAEEVVAVTLIDEARLVLEIRKDEGMLTEGAEHHAREELRELFELFEDDEVLGLFTVAGPVGGEDLEAWFDPFGGTAPTGYLNDCAEPTHDRF